MYSAGHCPVCADSGAVLLLKAHGSGRLFFFCPLCGVAWPEPPLDRRLDTVFDLLSFAPDGVVLPTYKEAVSTGVNLTDVSPEDWYSMLKGQLRPD